MGLKANEERLKEALERICGLHDMKGDFWKTIADAKVLLAELYPEVNPTFEYQWKIIPNFSNYEVSTKGEVRRAADGWKCGRIKIEKGYVLKGAIKRNGYLQFTLVDDSGKNRHMNAHRLVALTYLGEEPHKNWVVAHLNHNKLDNDVHNLKWVSNSVNQLQSRSYIGYKKSVTPEQVEAIKKEYLNCNNQSEVARLLNISRNVVSKIVNGVTYVDYERMNYA